MTSTKRRAVPESTERARVRNVRGPAVDGPRLEGAPRLVVLQGVPAAESVRWPRVRTAKERIDTGYYEREDVQDLVVNALLNELKRG